MQCIVEVNSKKLQRSPVSESVFSDDIEMRAWAITARHLTAGQMDTTKMIADAIRQERARCAELFRVALGPDANHLAVFVENPQAPW